MAPSVLPLRRVGAAVTPGPRLKAVLAEAARFAQRIDAPWLLIHGGAADAQKEAAFCDALRELGLPPNTRRVWQPGEPAQAIAAAAAAERVELLVAGVLDHKGAEPPTFLGAVARPLAEQAPCSVLLLSQPQVDPRPFRRIVVVTDFSECAKMALHQALWLAQADAAERVDVIALYTAFMQARAGRGASGERAVRTREETERRLCEFVAGAPTGDVALDADLVEGTTGFGVYAFAQAVGADLLVMPAPAPQDGGVPPGMEWALQVTPCSLWVVREGTRAACAAQAPAPIAPEAAGP